MHAVLSRRLRAAVGVVALTAAAAASVTSPVGRPGALTSFGLGGSALTADDRSTTGLPLLEAAVTPQTFQAPANAAVPAGPAAIPAVGTGVPPADDVTQASLPMSLDEPIQGGLTAREAQRTSAKIRAGHDAPSTADAGEHWTAAMGKTAAARARSWLGLPYSWAGGGSSGPSAGRCEPGSSAELDCRIVGFDCSGLMMYAWGAYTGLPHLASSQQAAGLFRPSVKQLRAGDLVFFSGYIPGGVGHVAIYEGKGSVIEAPQSGDVVRRSSLARLMANDGTYRGAVRPMTPATPALTGITAVANKGGKVTLRGADLAGVESLHVGDRTIEKFRRTGKAITFTAPRAAHSQRHTVEVTAETAWGATSAPIALTYAAKPAKRAETAKPAPTTSEPSTPSKPKSDKPTSSPSKPKPDKPKPTPTEPKPAPSKSKPSVPTVPTVPTSSGSAATEPSPSPSA